MISTDTDHLVGTSVRLWPYVRGYYARDTMYRLWKTIEDAQAGPQLFWGSQDRQEIHGDLVMFCRFFDDASRHLVILTNLDGSAIIGCIWFDELIPEYRAFGSIFLVPDSRGKQSQEAIQLGIRYGFETFQLRSIWGLTPWPAAVRLCHQAGFETVAVLPGFTKLDGICRDVTVLRLTKEQFDGQRVS